MSTPYVQLNRTFYAVSEKELEDVETLLQLADSPFDLGGLDWKDLLEYPRVLILAQGGVGKTREMQEQAAALCNSGKAAFFMPLELLDDDPVSEILGFDDGHRFETWLNEEDTLGWFFLDSVDELKITHGTLQRALGKFAASLGRDALRRARIILSCRPKDWSETIDRGAVERTINLPPAPKFAGTTEEDAFVATLHRDRDTGNRQGDEADTDALKIVMLLPLDRKRTRQFAEARDIPDIDGFMDEVIRRNADEFVKRPMDLITITDMWTTHRKLGTRREQLELNVQSNLIEDAETIHQKESLSVSRAREGVNRIALAMALAKRSSIHADAPSLTRRSSPSALSAEAILNDWGAADRERLLRLPIFDLAAIGQVRFHHSSIKDFLAAERLHFLNQKNMSNRELHRLFIAEAFGETVSIPSMRSIAAWLSLKNDLLRSEIMRVSPQLLIASGDPEALPIHEREALLSAFAEAHGTGGWRGLGFDITQLRRLSDPALGSAVRKTWNANHENEEVLELLVDMIWHGPLPDCADLAESVAFNSSIDESTRCSAVRALIACGQRVTVRRFVDEVLTHPDRWTSRWFCRLFDEVVPDYLSTDRLISMLEHIVPEGRRRSDIDWELDLVINKLSALSDEMLSLRDGLCRLIEEGAHDEIAEYSMHSRFGSLTEHLAAICKKQIEAGAQPDHSLVHACVVASRFEIDRYSQHEKVDELAEIARTNISLREAVYWDDVALLTRFFPEKDARWRAWRSSGDRALICPLVPSDSAWLESALTSDDTNKRLLALHQLLDIWRATDRPDDILVRLRDAVADDQDLVQLIDAAQIPYEEPAPLKESREHISRRQRANRAKEHKRIADWKEWRTTICAAPEESFNGEVEDSNVVGLVRWMALHAGRDVSDGPWNSDAVRRIFGDDVFQHAIPALKRYWRKHHPLLWSERVTEDRHTFLWVWLYGLCALKAETSEPDWIERLSDEEVKLATRYAVTQFNGFPEFMDDLIAERPAPVVDVLSIELRGQFDAWSELNGDLPMLQTIKYGGEALQRLMATPLREELRRWPSSVPDDDKQGRALNGFSNLVRILCDVNDPSDTSFLLRIAKERFEGEPQGPYATLWMKAVFQLDFQTGVHLLTETFRDTGDSAQAQAAIGLLAALFGDRGDAPLVYDQAPENAAALGSLLRFALNFVRYEDDLVHDGVFTPNIRDHAETARSAIFSALIGTPGPDARRILLEIADDPLFAFRADRWRYLSLEKVAEQADFTPYGVDAIQTFEQSHELVPRNSEELLEVVIDRLDDLGHDLHHHRFSPLKEWRLIENEADAQRLLAGRLDSTRLDSYTAVTREEEVAERNRTDVTLSTLGNDAEQAVIEIKIANKNRTATTLAQDIEEQLVAKYLRHNQCRAGCFLVINRGDKATWRHPTTGKKMTFSKLVSYLAEIAQSIEEKNGYRIKLEVFGLDLTDDGSTRHAFNI